MESILDDATKSEVQRAFGELKEEVFVDLYTRKSSLIVPGSDESDTANEAAKLTEELLTEVAALSPKIKLTVHDAAVDPEPAKAAGLAEYVPSIIFRNAQTRGKLRYLGIPAGYEFKTLIDTVVALGKNDDGLAPESKTQLGAVASPVNIKVYVTPG